MDFPAFLKPKGRLTELERAFLLSYLNNRSVSMGIDQAMQVRYPNIQDCIRALKKDGLLIVGESKYSLTEAGKTIQKNFKILEQQRKKRAYELSRNAAMSGDYLTAHNILAKYDQEGYFYPYQETLRKETAELPHYIKNYITSSNLLDFSDSYNSDNFKDHLRRFYVVMNICGAGLHDYPLTTEEIDGEILVCPTLDQQLKEKCTFPNPPRLRIYFETKVIIFNYIQIKKIKSWDGQFILGMYDCTNQFHADIAQFQVMVQIGIPNFPKTFQTFEKHKRANSEKYQEWMRQYSRLKAK